LTCKRKSHKDVCEFYELLPHFQAVEVGQGGWLELFPRGSLNSSDKGVGTGGGGWEKIAEK